MTEYACLSWCRYAAVLAQSRGLVQASSPYADAFQKRGLSQCRVSHADSLSCKAEQPRFHT